MSDKLNFREAIGAFLVANRDLGDSLDLHGRYDVVCLGPDGKVKWTDHIDNLITTAGKNDLLATYLFGCYMGLKGAGTVAAGDTQSVHAGWSELGGSNAPTYSGSRKIVTFGTASGGSITSNTQSFSITGSGTVYGCFINVGGSSTKDDTAGTLFSAGDFSSGAKSVGNGDTLNVTYTLSA